MDAYRALCPASGEGRGGSRSPGSLPVGQEGTEWWGDPGAPAPCSAFCCLSPPVVCAFFFVGDSWRWPVCCCNRERLQLIAGQVAWIKRAAQGRAGCPGRLGPGRERGMAGGCGTLSTPVGIQALDRRAPGAFLLI